MPAIIVGIIVLLRGHRSVDPLVEHVDIGSAQEHIDAPISFGAVTNDDVLDQDLARKNRFEIEVSSAALA